MHADKVRTADLPAFRLEPRDAVVLISFVGIAAYVLGLFVGIAL